MNLTSITELSETILPFVTLLRRRSTSIGRLEEALEDEHEQYQSMRKNTSQLDKQIDVHKPLVNLLDNLVTMGSLYGGDNLMLTSQYKKVQFSFCGMRRVIQITLSQKMFQKTEAKEQTRVLL